MELDSDGKLSAGKLADGPVLKINSSPVNNKARLAAWNARLTVLPSPVAE